MSDFKDFRDDEDVDGYTEAYDALREERTDKRRRNTEASTRILIEKGIEFQSHNDGVHLVVGAFDFWPSTGLFMDRRTRGRGRGVFNLIKLLKKGSA